MTGSTKKFSQVGVMALALLITSSIDNVRNLPVIALFGPTLPFFFALAAIFFLLPTALLSAQLAVNERREGGIYAWAKQAYGPKTGALAIWLQWINTMVWFPSILAFIVATAAYILDPQIIKDKTLLLGICLLIFWAVTLINLFGLKIATWFAAICTFLGMLLPMGIIILLGLFWFLQGEPRHLHFTTQNVWPHLNNLGGWTALTGIMAGFLGIELTNVHARDLNRPEKLFPRALTIAVAMIIITMVGGALAIATIIPTGTISLVAGISQTLHAMLDKYHMQAWLPVIITLVVLGSVGKLVNWLIAPAKGLMQAAEDNFLPLKLAKCNKYGMPTRILLLQAVVVSIISGAILVIPTINGIYWLLTDLSTELYLLMYLILFLSAWRICKNLPANELKIVHGHGGLKFTCSFGLIGTCLSLIVGFIPTTAIAVGGDLRFELVFIGGLIILLTPVFWLWRYHNKHNSNHD